MVSGAGGRPRTVEDGATCLRSCETSRVRDLVCFYGTSSPTLENAAQLVGMPRRTGSATPRNHFASRSKMIGLVVILGTRLRSGPPLTRSRQSHMHTDRISGA